MKTPPHLSLALRGINDPSPDDVPRVRKAYEPVFDVARSTGLPAEDFLRDINRLSHELWVFVPGTHRSFIRRLAKDAVVPSPDSPGDRLLMLNWFDWSNWQRLALFVRDLLALHQASSQGHQHVQRLSRMLREAYPELVSAYEQDRKARTLAANTDTIDAMPLD